MADKLRVYNDALIQIGSRRLASLSEDREPKRVIDAIWDDVIAFCLEQAMWNFAIRTAAASSTSLPGTLNYGMTNAYTRPTDCIHTYMLSYNVAFAPPAEDVVEADTLYLARGTPLYVRYTSNDATNGGANLTKWTNGFAKFLATYLASEICYRLTRNLDKEKVLQEKAAQFLVFARAKDALAGSVGLKQYNTRIRREFIPGDDPPEGFPFQAVEEKKE